MQNLFTLQTFLYSKDDKKIEPQSDPLRKDKVYVYLLYTFIIHYTIMYSKMIYASVTSSNVQEMATDDLFAQ